MNYYIVGAACFLLITAIFLVATTSIATECYDANKEFKEKKKDNVTFTTVTLVLGVLMILSALGSIYLGVKDK
jgi:hypothetical protein